MTIEALIVIKSISSTRTKILMVKYTIQIVYSSLGTPVDPSDGENTLILCFSYLIVLYPCLSSIISYLLQLQFNQNKIEILRPPKISCYPCSKQYCMVGTNGWNSKLMQLGQDRWNEIVRGRDIQFPNALFMVSPWFNPILT